MAKSNVGLVGATLLCVYACAKATDSDLGGGHYDPRAGRAGSGAKPGTAGFGGKGGSSAGGTAGRGGSSGGKAGTGTGGTSTGGTGTGSSGNTTSTGGSGGSTGGTSTNQGGEAGDDGVPPDVLENAQVVLYYVSQQAAVSTKQPQMRLFLMNQSDDALDLRHVLVRYWITSEASSFKLESFYAAPMTSSRVLAYVDAGTKSRIEVTFSTGSIPPHNTDRNQTEFQVALQSETECDQSNDWSFNASIVGEAQPNVKITVYLADKLIWGCEPSGKCAGEDGAGGAGGQGGQGGEPGTGGTSGSGGISGTGGVGPGGAGQGGEPAAGQGGA